MKYKILSNSLLFASLAIVAVVAISGCSSSTSTPPVTAQKNVTPTAGSTYTYHKHEIDSASGKAPVVTDSVIVASVISSGAFYQGKDSVVTVLDDFDTLRYKVETNNDVSVYFPSFGSGGFVFNNRSPWLTLPLGSKQKGIQLFTYDTTIVVSGLSEVLTITGLADYIGTDEVDTGTTHSKFVTGPQAKITISLMGTNPVPVTITSTQTYSFDYYSAGNYFHSISNTIMPDVKFLGSTVLPGNTSLSEKILTAFTIK